MAKTNLSIAPSTKQEWTVDTVDFFMLRLEGTRCILIALSSNIDEFEPLEGRASDGAIVLAIEHVTSELLTLERLSYDLEDPATLSDLGELPLKLMRARALTEILSDMFGADDWKINLGDRILTGYLGAVVRLLDEANLEAVRVHDRRFPPNKSPIAAA